SVVVHVEPPAEQEERAGHDEELGHVVHRAPRRVVGETAALEVPGEAPPLLLELLLGVECAHRTGTPDGRSRSVGAAGSSGRMGRARCMTSRGNGWPRRNVRMVRLASRSVRMEAEDVKTL